MKQLGQQGTTGDNTVGLLLQTDIFWPALCVWSTQKVIWVKEYNTECVLYSSHKHQINMNKWGECSSVGFGWVSLSNLLEVKACGLFCCGWIVLSKHVPILLPSCFCVYKKSREYTSYIYNDCLYMKYKLPIFFFQDFCDLLCTCRFRFWHFLISPNPK